MTIRALNVLVGGRTPGPVIARTAPQRQSQGMVLIKALRLIMRARSAAEPLEGRTAWASLIDDQDELPNPALKSKLVADRCDLLEESGLVDPIPLLSSTPKRKLSLARLNGCPQIFRKGYVMAGLFRLRTGTSTLSLSCVSCVLTKLHCSSESMPGHRCSQWGRAQAINARFGTGRTCPVERHLHRDRRTLQILLAFSTLRPSMATGFASRSATLGVISTSASCHEICVHGLVVLLCA